MNSIASLRPPSASFTLLWAMAARWGGANAIVILITFAVTLLVYSALASGVVLTNHTLPNSYYAPYPSFKTWSEGRWFADILIHTLGGGSQAFEAVVGFAIQAVNGALFASLFKVRGTALRTLIALLIALHPTLLDYYSFTSDNITFTFGETLLIAGVILLDRWPRLWLGAAACTVLFTLAFASYQPKIAIAGVLLIGWCVSRVTFEGVTKSLLINVGLRSTVVFIASTLLYWISVKLTVTAPVSIRTHLNSPTEIIQAVGASYATVFQSFTDQSANLPAVATIGAWGIIVLGVLTLLFANARRSIFDLLIILVLLACLPAAIRLSFLINDQTWENAGRIATVYAYVIALLAVVAIPVAGRFPVSVVAGLTLYGFGIIAIEENSFMQMKSLYEEQAINRIVGRIEEVVPDKVPHPLVVIGDVPLDAPASMLKFRNRPFPSQIWESTFISYRQVDVANFFLGSNLLTSPSKADVDKVVADEKSRPIWPAPGSVYLLNNIVVVVLQHMGTGVRTTWTTG